MLTLTEALTRPLTDAKCLLMIIQRITAPIVTPANWEKPNCSLKKPWFISYRIYTDQGVKQKIIKQMNRCKTWEERVKCTKELLEIERKKLDQPKESIPVSSPKRTQWETYVTLQAAMLDMCDKKACVPRHRRNLKTKVNRFCEVGTSMGYNLTLDKISVRVIYAIMDELPKRYSTFTAKTHNCYVKDLGGIFEMLRKRQYISSKMWDSIEKKPVVKTLRQLPTHTERIKIDKKLREKHYCLWRFTRLFFLSGARMAELIRMETKDISVKNKYFKVTILKGQSRREELKAMLPESVPLWKEVVSASKKHPFGPNLAPGDKPFDDTKPQKAWRKLIKEELGINVDLYSLKHLFLDMLAQKADIDLAQAAGDHQHSSTTETFYALGEKSRKLERLKQLNIKFK